MMTKEQKGKADTIHLYAKLIKKLKKPSVKMKDYESVTALKESLVPKFNDYHNSCPLCAAYWNEEYEIAECNRCPLGDCVYGHRSNVWTGMVVAMEDNDKKGMVEILEILIKTVEESKWTLKK